MEEERAKILPIDRGWAWVVVAASLGLFSLHAGGFKCQGILFVELTEKYEGTYSTPTLIWVITLKNTLIGLSGPLVSVFIVKTSHRTAAILGVILDAISYIGLAYSNSMITMLLFHSLVGGIGNGFLVQVIFLSSGPYFKERRALALGIVAGGSGVGTIIIPYVLRPIFDNFDFSGAVLLYGGFTIQFLVLACLLRPISYYESLHHKELQNLYADEDKPEDVETKLLEAVSVKGNRHDETEAMTKLLSVQNKDGGTAVRTSQHIISTGDLFSSAVLVVDDSAKESERATNKLSQDHLNWGVLKMPKFLMFAFSIGIYACGISVVYSGIPPLGKESGIAKGTIAVAMMAAGCCEIPFRVLNGLLADKGIITATQQYTLCIFIAGVITLVTAIVAGLPGIIMVLVGMSSVGTSVFSLVPVVLGELIGLENITSGMGLQTVFQSCAVIISSFVVGAIYDYTNSWRIVYFYICSAMILASFFIAPYCIYSLVKNAQAKLGKMKIFS